MKISTDGTYNFGTKHQAAPVLWLFGSECYINGAPYDGVANAADGSAFPATQGIAATGEVSKTRPGRHGLIDAVLHGATTPNAHMDISYGALDQFSRPNSIFCSWWARYPFNTANVFTLETVSIVGTPKLSADGRDGDGEEYYREGSGGTEAEGRFITILDGASGGEVPAGTGPWLMAVRYSWANSIRGQVLVGKTSGARVTMVGEGPTFLGDGSTKHARINTSPRDSGAQIRYVASHRADASTAFVYSAENNNLYQNRSYFEPNAYPWGGGQDSFPGWVNQVIYLDGSGQQDPQYFVDDHYYDFLKTPNASTYKAALSRGGLVDQQDGLIPLSRIDETLGRMIPQVVGLGISVGHHYNHDMTEVVIDYQPHRVVLGNAPTWNAVTQTEIQRTITWSQSQIECAINKGDLSQAWLYILTSTDQPLNNNGVEFA
jgi:hypothetical protein